MVCTTFGLGCSKSDEFNALDHPREALVDSRHCGPKINANGGRDHHPAVYSQVLAGGGIRGGQVYGSSDDNGARPASNPCTPADFHATVYKALGIDPRTEVHDNLGRPFQICSGHPLPLF